MPSSTQQWPLWKKILFRFFFLYMLLVIAPWTAIESIPGTSVVMHYYDDFINWSVHAANKWLFHIRKELVPPAGSGDTSYGWAEQWFYTAVAAVGCLIWSFADRKRPNYKLLNYWNCTFIRFGLAAILFSYGVSKLLVLQMPFPSLSALATPLGNYTPMRFFWLLMGYSSPYEFFSGAMEVIAALLLFYRRTVTLGALLAFVIFANIAMLNLSYDIPVKLFSMQLVLYCIILIANEKDRLLDFFVRNRATSPDKLYKFPYYSKKWRIARIAAKLFFVIFICGSSAKSDWERYNSFHAATNIAPLQMGMYEVSTFAVNKDTLPPLLTDTIRWKDMILDLRNSGSINVSDSGFRKLYGRSYFSYNVDSTKHLLLLKKNKSDSLPLIAFQYRLMDDNNILLFGKRNNDSLFVALKRSKRRFQLPDNEFHWLLETVP